MGLATFIFMFFSFSQFGPPPRQLCHENADKLNNLLQRMGPGNCKWVELLPVPPPNQPAKPTRLIRHGSAAECDGNFECTSPYSEITKTYLFMDYACYMSIPPPAGTCIDTSLTNQCKIEMIKREHQLCDL